MAIVQQELPGFKRTLFYVYILYRPDGRPFYVGKGSGERIEFHRWAAEQGYKARRYSIIRKIWREGGDFAAQKVFEIYDENEAFAMERYLIASIGRENLTNETDGGDGNYGWVPDEQWRRRKSEQMRGRDRGPEWRANVQAAKIGKPRSEECKAKIRAALTGRKLPPEHVEATAAGNRSRKRSDDARRRMSEARRGRSKPGLQGGLHHQSKLTTKQVLEIRRLKRSGHTRKQLSVLFGISTSTVSKIIGRYTWKHLPDE